MLVAAQEIFTAACGIQFPDQGSNLGPLHWEQSLNHWTTRKVLPWLILRWKCDVGS